MEVGEKTHFVIATTYRLLTLTWKKLVEPSVMIGDLTSLFETTCIRNTSAIDLLNVRPDKCLFKWRGARRT
jgi:hypothetical protein